MGLHHHHADRPSQRPFKGKSKGKSAKATKGRVEAGGTRPLSASASKGSRAALSKRSHLPPSCPRLIALLPCHPGADVRAARNLLLVATGALPHQLKLNSPVTANGFTFVEASTGDAFSFLDVAKVADILVPIVCPKPGSDSSDCFGVDERSEQLLGMVKAQGLPTCVILTQGLDVRSSPVVKRTCARYMHTLLPNKPRIMAVEKSLDAIRCLKNVSLKSIGWRDMRPFMLAEAIDVAAATDATCMVALSGFVRGRNQILSPDRLVHVTGYGDFQLDRVLSDGGDEFVADPMQRPSLDGLCEPDPMANEQSLITEQELEECEQEAAAKRQEQRKQRLIGVGLTDVQAAWEAAISSDDDDDNMRIETTPPLINAADDGADHVAMVLKFRMERDELEFPDEVDCPVHDEARVRFQKYRGAQATSWDPLEHLPAEYARIVRFQRYPMSRKRALADSTQGPGAHTGSHCRLVLNHVPHAMAQEWLQRPFLVLSALHQYERQVSVSHYKIRRAASVAEPIKSKAPVVIACGFRRFPARPIFSQDTPNCDQHRVERFLHANRFTIASCYARIDLSHASALVFDGDEMVASGTHIGVDPDRLLIKRIVLTGYPIRVHKRRAVVRYMFFRPSDIRWFAPIALTTKFGLKGEITEALGTHGYMKCSFNAMVKYNDTVCMNLFKRQYPPFSAHHFLSN